MSRRPQPRTVLTVVAACAFAVVVLLGFHLHTPPDSSPHETYISRPVDETGAINRVAGVYLNYRLYDTLIEILVFFVAVLGVRHYLSTREHTTVPSLAESEVVRASSSLLFPLAVLLGVYLVGLGHLSPGGGFGAGVIVASGALLVSISLGVETLERRVPLGAVERIEQGALLLVLISALVPWAAGRIPLTDLLPKGKPGQLLSGGMIPVYNALVGLKVLAGSWLILRSFVRHRGEI